MGVSPFHLGQCAALLCVRAGRRVESNSMSVRICRLCVCCCTRTRYGSPR
jgi:hypothetical protein